VTLAVAVPKQQQQQQVLLLCRWMHCLLLVSVAWLFQRLCSAAAHFGMLCWQHWATAYLLLLLLLAQL
jgi:hypothetical protein